MVPFHICISILQLIWHSSPGTVMDTQSRDQNTYAFFWFKASILKEEF